MNPIVSSAQHSQPLKMTLISFLFAQLTRQYPRCVRRLSMVWIEVLQPPRPPLCVVWYAGNRSRCLVPTGMSNPPRPSQNMTRSMSLPATSKTGFRRLGDVTRSRYEMSPPFTDSACHHLVPSRTFLLISRPLDISWALGAGGTRGASLQARGRPWIDAAPSFHEPGLRRCLARTSHPTRPSNSRNSPCEMPPLIKPKQYVTCVGRGVAFGAYREKTTLAVRPRARGVLETSRLICAGKCHTVWHGQHRAGESMPR